MAGSVVVYDAYDHVARVEDVPGDVFSMMSGVIGGCVDCVDDDSFGSRGLDLWVNDSGVLPVCCRMRSLSLWMVPGFRCLVMWCSLCVVMMGLSLVWVMTRLCSSWVLLTLWFVAGDSRGV